MILYKLGRVWCIVMDMNCVFDNKCTCACYILIVYVVYVYVLSEEGTSGTGGCGDGTKYIMGGRDRV